MNNVQFGGQDTLESHRPEAGVKVYRNPLLIRKSKSRGGSQRFGAVLDDFRHTRKTRLPRWRSRSSCESAGRLSLLVRPSYVLAEGHGNVSTRKVSKNTAHCQLDLLRTDSADRIISRAARSLTSTPLPTKRLA